MNTLKEYYEKSLEYKPQHPIDKQTADFICNFINDNQINLMLEIGSGIGYSANYFALNSSILGIDSYEKEFDFYTICNSNKLSQKINFIWKNFLDEFDNYYKYQLIFIDASKTKQIELFEKSINFLDDNGFIIVDNIDLKRLKEKYLSPSVGTKTIKSIEKILVKSEEFKKYLKNLPDFKVWILEIGDGLAICQKK
ncbi:MAG: hypothetical protein K2O21_02935 [Malacoplasma sp.]|nr:hypothetical protein [Malacoplasma sp.]MDE7088111.1 hypothetical protein [Malacoplasma sp.]